MSDAHWENLRASEIQSSAILRLLLDDVRDLHTFLEFLDGLRADREEADRKEASSPPGPYSSWNGWKNNSIATFLESAVACVSDNLRLNQAFLASENPWKAAASIIYAGKYYE